MLMQIVTCAANDLVIFVFVSVMHRIVVGRSILVTSYWQMARIDYSRKLMGLTPRRDNRGRYVHAVLSKALLKLAWRSCNVLIVFGEAGLNGQLCIMAS
ncbi:hypothetical protein PHISCL_01156 [Aspergillus sclerotialis]|uniref:Uncharacterized protein n=1 Tax=Aspergillus sclerotialis TaxID=2070753 RepID=A0A3A2ZW30_9EURO|nr:hypothetical protein PHISCL_01156 [Aspergillus sclerotialis]